MIIALFIHLYNFGRFFLKLEFHQKIEMVNKTSYFYMLKTIYIVSIYRFNMLKHAISGAIQLWMNICR